MSMWFRHETNLVTMIDSLEIMKEELDEAAYKINGQIVKAGLEVSPQTRPLTRAVALLVKGLDERGGDESTVRAFHKETSDILPCGKRYCCQIYTRGRRSST